MGATTFVSGAEGRNRVGNGRAVAVSAGSGVNVSVGGCIVSDGVGVPLAASGGAWVGIGVFSGGNVTANTRGVFVAKT